jgi:chemotaxis protein CheD
MTPSPALVVVGISEARVSSDSGASLVTYALGSCVAIAIYDPVVRVGGLLHVMLPDSALDRDNGASRPFTFADTGIPLLLRRAVAAGAESRRLVVRIAGGARVMGDGGLFNIGERNTVAVRKTLSRAGLMIASEAVGGVRSRTVRLDVGSGKFWIRAAAGPEREIGGAA